MDGFDLPDWMTLPDWLEPKLLVLFMLIGFVLFLSREPRKQPEKVKSAGPALLKHGRQ